MRRFIRISWLASTAVFIATTLLAQFCKITFRVPNVVCVADCMGASLLYADNMPGRGVYFTFYGDFAFHPEFFFSAPVAVVQPIYILIPWWLILPLWLLATLLILRQTRPKKSHRAAFPIQPPK